MPELTVVHTPGRGKAFGLGLLVGVLVVTLMVVLLWLLGIIDVGGKRSREPAANATTNETGNSAAAASNRTSNDTAVNNQTTNLENISNEVANETARTANASPFYVDAVLAKSVDDQAHPVDETSTFAKKDARFYVVITLGNDIPADTEVSVEWFQGTAQLSDY